MEVINNTIEKIKLPKPFYMELPEVYQIEITSDCNLSCKKCTRDLYKRDKKKYIDVGLVERIAERDLGGSFFVELQLMGEPLLHPQLGKIIDILKQKVAVGLSTNGYLIDNRLEDLVKLDYLTVSMDGLSGKVLDNVERLLKRNVRPKVDLQLVEMGKWEEEYKYLKSIIKQKNWDVILRTVPDCSLVTRGDRDKKEVEKELCLNPYLSVTIQADGDVVPCCFAWDKEVVYGNLNNNSLKEIWENSKVVKDMRKKHEDKKGYFDICSKCYMRSPTILHLNILKNHYKK